MIALKGGVLDPIVYASWSMKLVQTAIADEEYRLLRERASKEGKSMKEIAREALRAHLLPDRVNPADPIFHAFPLIHGRGRRTTGSVDHDKILYSRRRYSSIRARGLRCSTSATSSIYGPGASSKS